MRHLLTILAALLLAAPVQAQTLKSLMYNTTNAQVVANTGTNVLTFPFYIRIADGGGIESTYSGTSIDFDGEFLNLIGGSAVNILSPNGIGFIHTNSAGATRTNLGLGATNDVAFNSISFGGGGTSRLTNDSFYFGTNLIFSIEDAGFSAPINALAGLNNNGNITIANTTATNGILFIYRTNNEPFLGLANLIASNNITISNETLFRVGVSEATNKAAQFGFRSTNTNGNGVAVFSVFGFNALMMVGADASTNAVIYSGGGTNNEVMTLIKNGATEFARPIAFSTTTHAAATRTNLGLGATSDPTFRDVSVRDLSIVGGSGGKIVYPSTNTAPANTTNVAAWIQVNVGTNSYRVPLYQ